MLKIGRILTSMRVPLFLSFPGCSDMILLTKYKILDEKSKVGESSMDCFSSYFLPHGKLLNNAPPQLG